MAVGLGAILGLEVGLAEIEELVRGVGVTVVVTRVDAELSQAVSQTKLRQAKNTKNFWREK
jgi:hypothetical protein